MPPAPRRRAFTHKATSTLGTAALLIALSACASGPSTSGDATPSATPSASTAAQSPTPSPTQDAADASTWIITPTSIGPLELGMVEDDYLSAVAPSFGLENRCEGLKTLASVDPALGFDLYTSDGGDPLSGDPAALRNAGVVAEADPLAEVDGSPRTKEGIGLGSTLTDLAAAYPSLEVWNDPRDEQQPEEQRPPGVDYIVTDGSSWTMFYVPDDRIRRIGITLDLPPVGFCS